MFAVYLSILITSIFITSLRLNTHHKMAFWDVFTAFFCPIFYNICSIVRLF